MNTATVRLGIFGAALVFALVLTTSAQANTISSALGVAGPNNYAILFLSTSGQPQMNGPGGSTGNVGYNGSTTLQLNGSAGPEVNGNLILGNNASVNNAAQVTGTIFTNQSAQLNAAQAAAISASAFFNGLTPTSVITVVNGTTTIIGTAGLNVLNLTGITLGNGRTLTLSGPAGAQFVINVSGNIVLNSASIVLAGGLLNTDVVFNVAGNVQTSGGLNNLSVINGIVLDLTGQIAMAPGSIQGELIAGGNNPQIVSGGFVTGTTTVPEPSSLLLLSMGVGALFVLRRRLV